MAGVLFRVYLPADKLRIPEKVYVKGSVPSPFVQAICGQLGNFLSWQVSVLNPIVGKRRSGNSLVCPGFSRLKMMLCSEDDALFAYPEHCRHDGDGQRYGQGIHVCYYYLFTDMISVLHAYLR